MLRLAQHVRRHPGRVTVPVGEHQDLAGPRDHVDAHLTEHLPLGRGHEDAAGAHDLVHRRNGLGAVGQGSHRLGTAHLENPVRPGDFRRRQGGIADGAVFVRRRHHNDFLHPGNPGGDHVHQNGGGEGLRAPGHAHAHPADGGVSLAHDDAGPGRQHKVVLHLLFMEPADVVRRLLQGDLEVIVQGVPGGVHLRRRHLQVRQGHAVEPLRVLQQCPVAALPHGGDHRVHGGAHVLLRPDVPVQDLLRVDLIPVQNANHWSVTSASLPRRVLISRCLN